MELASQSIAPSFHNSGVAFRAPIGGFYADCDATAADIVDLEGYWQDNVVIKAENPAGGGGGGGAGQGEGNNDDDSDTNASDIMGDFDGDLGAPPDGEDPGDGDDDGVDEDPDAGADDAGAGPDDGDPDDAGPDDAGADADDEAGDD